MAAVAARRVENVGRRLHACETSSAESLIASAGLAVRVRLQVEPIEELVPVIAQLIRLSRPSARWSHATRCVTPLPLALRPRLARYQS